MSEENKKNNNTANNETLNISMTDVKFIEIEDFKKSAKVCFKKYGETIKKIFFEIRLKELPRPEFPEDGTPTPDVDVTPSPAVENNKNTETINNENKTNEETQNPNSSNQN